MAEYRASDRQPFFDVVVEVVVDPQTAARATGEPAAVEKLAGDRGGQRAGQVDPDGVDAGLSPSSAGVRLVRTVDQSTASSRSRSCHPTPTSQMVVAGAGFGQRTGRLLLRSERTGAGGAICAMASSTVATSGLTISCSGDGPAPGP